MKNAKLVIWSLTVMLVIEGRKSWDPSLNNIDLSKEFVIEVSKIFLKYT